MTTPHAPPILTLRNALVGIGGGLASVMMFYSAFRGGTALGLVLLPLLPLPALIAGLGWGIGAALLALLSATGAVAALVTLPFALGTALLIGAPATGVVHALSLARYDDSGTLTQWYPIGRVVMLIALYGAALPVLLISFNGGSFDALAPAMTQAFKVLVAEAPPGSEWRTLADDRLQGLVEVWVQVLPAMIAIYWTLFFTINVYLAGRVVRISGQLFRPWPDLHWMTFPPGFALAPLLAIAGVWLGGSPRVLGIAALGAFLIAFLFQGLSAVHAVAQARGATWAMSAVYAALAILSGVAMPMIALLGVTETLFHVRRRFVPIPTALPLGSL